MVTFHNQLFFLRAGQCHGVWVQALAHKKKSSPSQTSVQSLRCWNSGDLQDKSQVTLRSLQCSLSCESCKKRKSSLCFSFKYTCFLHKGTYQFHLENQTWISHGLRWKMGSYHASTSLLWEPLTLCDYLLISTVPPHPGLWRTSATDGSCSGFNEKISWGRCILEARSGECRADLLFTM